MQRFRQRICTLRDLKILAERLELSLTSAAIRYCECDIEASSVVLCRGGKVIYHVASWEMRRMGFGSITRGTRVPSQSVTARMLSNEDTSSDIVEDEVYAGAWYHGRWGKLWEEAMILGSSGLSLTYLVREESPR